MRQDLEEIDLLEEYVQVSQCMLLTASKGYFFSRNCALPLSNLQTCTLATHAEPRFAVTGLRELDATFEQQKPYFMVHEADEGRGGMPLDVLRKDFESVRPEACAKLFGYSTPIITWHRVQDYQLLSLRMIAELMVHEMPPYAGLKQPPKLYLRGDVLFKTFTFKNKPTIYISANNPGAMEMADELLDKYGTAGLSVSRQRPLEFTAYDINKSELDEAAAPSDAGGGSTTCTHMLLYLCKETFAGEVGQRLAHEIREAQRLDVKVVMIHECDADKSGCPFDNFFRAAAGLKSARCPDGGLHHSLEASPRGLESGRPNKVENPTISTTRHHPGGPHLRRAVRAHRHGVPQGAASPDQHGGRGQGPWGR